jgi:hypothetical protein
MSHVDLSNLATSSRKMGPRRQISHSQSPKCSNNGLFGFAISEVVNLRVEQAIYGEHRGGHGLRHATGDRSLATDLASRLDLPDTAPSGVTWSPFTSGFVHADRYVLARTFLDPRAPRSGMVLSHALIAPIQNIAHCADLRPLFARLITEASAPQSLETLDLASEEGIPPLAPELTGAAAALTTRGGGPVVRLGLDGFEDLIVALWSRLWPAIRRTFVFRLSFSPGDLIESPTPTLICTPATLAVLFHGIGTPLRG